MSLISESAKPYQDTIDRFNQSQKDEYANKDNNLEEPNKSNITAKAEKLLDSENQTYKELDQCFDYLCSENDFESKKEKFLDTNQPDNFLGRFAKEVNENSIEFSKEEGDELNNINGLLLEKNQIVDEIISVLIETQRLRLITIGLDPKKINSEIIHIKKVVALTKIAYPTFPILHLAAAIHDSYKYDKNASFQLGLHELASTYLGTELIKDILNEYKTKLELNTDQINLTSKLIKRAVLTHGTTEYPMLNASYSDQDHPEIGNLHGNDIYFRPNQKSTDINVNSIVDISVMGLNYLDALTGTEAESFIKYNHNYRNHQLFFQKTLKNYMLNSIFSSFDSNINMLSGKKLDKSLSPDINTVILKNLEVKRLLSALVSGDIGFVKKYDKAEANKGIKLLKIKAEHEFKKLCLEFNTSQKDADNNLTTESEVKINNQRTNFDNALFNLIIHAEVLVNSNFKLRQEVLNQTTFVQK